jgi:hypothetical protein
MQEAPVMNLALVDVIIATAAVVGVGVAFTLWKFRSHPTHDPATTELLRHFFEGKACAICGQTIPPVHVHGPGMKPGLLNPETHKVHSWNDIPDADLAKALQTHKPVCSSCEVAESFRQRFPDLVLDGDHSSHPASQTQGPPLGAGS